MAPSRVAANQWARQTFGRGSCRVTQIAPKACQYNTCAPRKKNACGPEFNSLLPTDHLVPSDCSRGSKQGIMSSVGSKGLNLPLSSPDSPDLILPGINDARVSTPPPWKSPYVVAFETPKVAVKQSETGANESPCSSPTKTPGRVAKVFAELLPITPRASSKRTARNSKRHGSCAVKRMIARVGTAIGLKAPKHQFRSLADLRRHLQKGHRSLLKAFREMESHLQELKQKEVKDWMRSNNADLGSAMELADFTKAISFFGVDQYHALHFFELMDTNGDGIVTFEEFKTALVRMPREVLLQDFRKRLLSKYSSISEAFKELSVPPGRHEKFTDGDQSKPLTREAFAFQLSRLGVDEQESSLLFDIIDTDASGAISMDELRETLREVAPSVSLEEFWHRFATRWPSIRVAASGPEGRRGATEQLFKILPAQYRGGSLDLPLGLSAHAWDIIAAQLDVSRPNAKDLFRQCATAKIWQGSRAIIEEGFLMEKQLECDLDDFFDELQLWSQTPRARQGAGMRQSYGRDLAQRLGSRKMQIASV